MTFKLDPAYAGAPMLCLISGRFTNTTGSVITVNNFQMLPGATSYQVTPTVFNAAAPSGVQPAGGKLTVFAAPRGGVAPAATNISPLPLGLPTAAGPLTGSEFVIDLSGFPGEIVSATCNYVPNARNGSSVTAMVSVIDQSNMNVYIQVMTGGSGTAFQMSPGASVCFRIAIKDSIGV